MLPGAIGAALLSIWNYHGIAVVSRFLTTHLNTRLAGILHSLPTMNVEDTCHALQLWGTSGLLGLEIDVNPVKWPNNRACCELLEYTVPKNETLDNRSIQVWLGLRRMALFRSDVIRVPGHLGERVLDVWKGTTGETGRQQSLNRWMIEWLERCEAADWQILPDESRLPFQGTSPQDDPGEDE